MDEVILRTVSRLVIPFIQMTGVYVILHGHLSPGGAFAGGAILGAAFVLGTMALGPDSVTGRPWGGVGRVLESTGGVVYVATGLIGVVLGASFLSNVEAGFPVGRPGMFLSAGVMPLIGAALGLKVAATLVSLFRGLAGGEGSD